MLDFIKGLISWLFKKIFLFLFPCVAWIVFFFENFSSVLASIWDYAFKWIAWFFQDFYLWFFQQVTEKLTSFFSSNSFVVSVAELSNDAFTLINCFLPLNEAFACGTLIITTMTAVFILRIILKAVPTIW